MSIDLEAYEAAKRNDMDEIKRCVRGKADLNMIIIGASDGQHEQLVWQAFRDGACLLFGIEHAKLSSSVHVSKYGKNISMHKVDGARLKGSHDSTV
jgi:tRNA(Leu) C34 or U34 (ribose-2'-O)-methylase TrmL